MYDNLWARYFQRLHFEMLIGQLDRLLRTKGDQVELYVDGPFASPLVDVLNSKTAICIAGGIGFTPFLCAIHHLMWVYHQSSRVTRYGPNEVLISRRNGWPGRPDRLHIVWCVQTAESLLWASKAIDQLIEDVWASPRPDKLEIRLHVTRPASGCRAPVRRPTNALS